MCTKLDEIGEMEQPNINVANMKETDRCTYAGLGGCFDLRLLDHVPSEGNRNLELGLGLKSHIR